MKIPDYKFVQIDALRRIIENLETEVRSLEGRGRDASRVRRWLDEAERELASR